MFLPRALSTLLISTLCCAASFAQDASSVTHPSEFEVASIRPADRNDGRRWFGFHLAPSGRLTTSGTNLNSLVSFAYIGFWAKAGAAKVSGGPEWVNSDQWDITAKVDDSVVDGWAKASDRERMEAIRPMVRALLDDRFHLKVHAETKMVNAYALVQIKSGSKLKEVAPPPPNRDPQAEEERARSPKPSGPPPGSFGMTSDKWTGNALQMGILTNEIASNANLDGPLVDETGLTGYYDFELKDSHDKDAPPLLDQIEQQLGLKVIQKKEAITTYVIDSAEKPTAN